ncbi:MAG: BACON domain-containing protein [Flavobacteriales bacterium]|nr:BACON domain-containing protein [Flavobacteriales bacterium]
MSYTVTSNGGSSRSGTITIGGQSFQITQAGVCSYSLSPTNNLSIPMGGGSYSVNVNTQAGCAWTASESLSWVSITSGSSGIDDGTKNYTVSSNPGTARAGYASL